MSISATGPGTAHAANRAELFDAIRAAGQISRVDLARERGLNGATVSTVVRSLMTDGLVVEAGRAESTGGKPAVLLSLAPDARFAVGINLDHGGISYVIANLGGEVVGRSRHQG
ncbi:MAG: winged helix-turn-helix domain-containing protein, partial [Nakamurella sp.]